MYTQVDYLTPMLQTGAGLIGLLFALPLLFHVVVRWVRYRRDARGLRTYQRRASLWTEALVGGGFLVFAAVMGGLGWLGLGRADEAMIANIHRAYPEIQSIESYAWTGSDALVDVVMVDGRTYSDVRVGRRATGEPVIDLNGPSDDREGDG
ncbi:hypothetical protein GCM10027591_08980 [Zhihengliuella somnathii]